MPATSEARISNCSPCGQNAAGLGGVTEEKKLALHISRKYKLIIFYQNRFLSTELAYKNKKEDIKLCLGTLNTAG